MTPTTKAGLALLGGIRSGVVGLFVFDYSDDDDPIRDTIVAIEQEARDAALAEVAAAVEGLPRYLGTEPHPFGSAIRTAAVLAAIAAAGGER